ncbi:PhoX family protein [Defluviimonas sp. WL0075]|uniref:PhoX family protein n=1 Tax=Albidovulum sediminicola TaxID=2984331 RepID=A0ABT2Z1X1_9RHOB|nr:PhoX family protein [Defluviimonas sp. WL0075]MCV2864997.1 PhoX family protein [Defluviimonas sp. WL0075]
MALKTTTRATLLGACAMAALSTAAGAQAISNVEWIGSDPSTTAEQLSDMWTNAKVKVTYDDGSTNTSELGYAMLMSSETVVGNNASASGVIYDKYMTPIADPTANGKPVTLETPDGTMLANIAGKIYHLSNWEYDWLLSDGSDSSEVMGPILPSSVTLTELSQDAEGTLTPVAQYPVDFSAVGGLAVSCNATVTPWGTFLTSEENYDADARQIEANRAIDPTGMSDVLRGITKYYNHGVPSNPYYRGVIPEVKVAADGSTSVVKHYAIGRGTYEMVQIMPDQRTVIGSHDGTNEPLTLFIADRAGDLSAGTLYAAKFEQESAENGGAFALSWISLGHASDDELKALVEGEIKFSDIFETADSAKDGFTEIFVDSDKNAQYLKVKNPVAAAFLETKRYAGMLGAATELRKSEGMALDPATSTVYLAISDIGKGMEEGKGSGVGGDQIRVSGMKSGAVYALSTAGGQADSDGRVIDSGFVPVSMAVPAGLMGSDLAEVDALGNKAHPDAIANPDNLYWSAAYNTLFIGEDSGMHMSNVLWAWQPGMSAPVRLLNAPAGAELTGLRVIENIGGFAYATTNAQHVGDFEPGDNAVLQQAAELIATKWNGGHKAPLGYVTGLPAASGLLK